MPITNTITHDYDENASENYIAGWTPGTAPVYDPITGALITAGTGGGPLRDAYNAYLASIENQNKFSWINHLLVPGLQAAANIALLNHQKSQYDDIEQKRIGYIDAAVDQWCDCITDLLDKVEDATDDVPEPAMYQPVSPSGEQWQTISDNLEIAPTAKAYACYINETHVEQDIIRQTLLNPKHYIVNEITWCSIHDLIKGDLAESTVVETLIRSKQKAVKFGRYGRSARQSARDLGITSHRLQKAARAEAREERASQNRDVSPISRQVDLREMMLTPQQRIGYGVQQAQLIQNSLQNAYNACARKPPALQAKLQIMMQKCQNTMTLLAGKAGLVNSNVVDYASVLNNQLTTITNGIGNLANGINFNTNQTPTATVNTAPPVQPAGPYGGGIIITPSK